MIKCIRSISLENTYKLLHNDITLTEATRITSNKDKVSLSNKFITRPAGFIVTDSYNHFAFPIQPNPVIDTSKFDLQEVYETITNKINIIFFIFNYFNLLAFS